MGTQSHGSGFLLIAELPIEKRAEPGSRRAWHFGRHHMTISSRRLLERFNFQKPWFAFGMFGYVAFDKFDKFSNPIFWLIAFSIGILAWAIVALVAFIRK